jgi:hypothetical protein
MSGQKYDINQPILVVVRRGRGGRGYAVAPVDSPTDVAACADANQVGDAIVEMLDDSAQPRVDIDELMRAAEGDAEEVSSNQEVESSQSQDDEEAGEEDGEEGEEEDDEEEPWYRASDPADALIIAGISKLFEKGRKVSKGSRRRRGRAKK